MILPNNDRGIVKRSLDGLPFHPGVPLLANLFRSVFAFLFRENQHLMRVCGYGNLVNGCDPLADQLKFSQSRLKL